LKYVKSTLAGLFYQKYCFPSYADISSIKNNEGKDKGKPASSDNVVSDGTVKVGLALAARCPYQQI